MAVGVKLALVAGSALVLLVPAFNSLNQVTVQDVDPPLTMENPPPNLPPPEEGDDVEVEVEPQPGPQPQTPECPPPKYEEVASYDWTMPVPPPANGWTQDFGVSPGAGGIAVVGNRTNFVGRLLVELIDPDGSAHPVYEYDSTEQDSETGPNTQAQQVFQAGIPGAVPGEWTARVLVEIRTPALGIPTAAGHVDVQFYQAFPCGGVGRA